MSAGPGPAARVAARPLVGDDPALVEDLTAPDAARLTDDQLLQALAAGDVVFMYGTRTPPPQLKAAARAVATQAGMPTPS